MSERSEKEEGEEVNHFGLGVHLIASIFFCHAALTYIAYPGPLDNWLYAVGSVFLPLVNMLFGLYYGVFGYWEAGWILGVAVSFLAFASLAKGATGYLSSILFVLLTGYLIFFTSPDASEIPDGQGAVNYVFAKANKEYPPSLTSLGDEKVEIVEETARRYRSRCIRADKEGCSRYLGFLLESAREVQ